MSHTGRCLLNSAIDFLSGHPADGHPALPHTSASRAPDPATIGELDWDKPNDAQSFEVTGQGRDLIWEVDRSASDGTQTVYRGRVLAYGDSRSTYLHSILTVDGAESNAGEQNLFRMHRQLTGGIKAGIERARP